MSLTETSEIPRREMVLFFVADKSGSMSGKKIESVNQAIVEVLPIIDKISSENPDAKIKIAALEFSSGCEWMYDEPKDASEFKWNDLTVEGLTDLGDACRELSSKLSRHSFLKSTTGAFAPVIILLTDGEPTDDYMGGIGKLRENKWFKHAIKIAIAIGNDANKDVLKEFTGNVESVIEVHNIDALKKIIRVASVASSTIGSQSSTTGDETKQDKVIEKIKEVTDETAGANTGAEVSVNSPAVDDDWD